MRRHRVPRLASTAGRKEPEPPIWEGKEYPRIEGGLRMVRVHSIQGPEWVRAYHRWSLRIVCHLLDERGEVSGFVNLGNNPDKPTMRKSRQSKFYRWYVLANGGQPPRPGQPMDWKIFLDKSFYARIEDCLKKSDGR